MSLLRFLVAIFIYLSTFSDSGKIFQSGLVLKQFSLRESSKNKFGGTSINVKNHITQLLGIVSLSLRDSVERWKRNFVTKKRETDDALFKINIEDFTEDVSEAIQLATSYAQEINSQDLPWKYHDAEKVQMKKVRLSSKGLSPSEKWPCVISRFSVEVSPRELLEILVDSRLAAVVNRFSAGRRDVAASRDRPYYEKLLWARCKKVVVSVRPFDFCSLLAAFEAPGALGPSWVLLFRRAEGTTGRHCPTSSEYQRAETLLGITVLSPEQGRGKVTRVWSLSHNRYPGLPPAWADRSSFAGALDYATQLMRVAASRTDRLQGEETFPGPAPLPPELWARLRPLLDHW